MHTHLANTTILITLLACLLSAPAWITWPLLALTALACLTEPVKSTP